MNHLFMNGLLISTTLLSLSMGNIDELPTPSLETVQDEIKNQAYLIYGNGGEKISSSKPGISIIEENRKRSVLTNENNKLEDLISVNRLENRELSIGEREKKNTNSQSDNITVQDFNSFFIEVDIIKKKNRKRNERVDFSQIENSIVKMQGETKLSGSSEQNSYFGDLLSQLSGTILYGEKNTNILRFV
ncbi:hypothetical protein [Enterococcus rotai]|uniref:hypothetical protein n=1 Tax=Enterococcus rotai TaxID=118060 RepID=UPI0032B4217A